MIINFEIKGKQYRYDSNKKDQVFFVDYCKNLENNNDKGKIELKILNIDENFGQPYLKENLLYEFIKHGKKKKIVTLKYKAKKRNSVKKGFRAKYSKIKIIGLGQKA